MMKRKNLIKFTKLALAFLLILGHIDAMTLVVGGTPVPIVDFVLEDADEEVDGDFDEAVFGDVDEEIQVIAPEEEIEIEPAAPEGDVVPEEEGLPVEVFAMPLQFVYPAFIVGEDEDLLFLPVEVLAGVNTDIGDISVRLDASEAIVFEYAQGGLMVVGENLGLVDLRPIRGLAEGTYLNTLIIEDGENVFLEIPLAVTVLSAEEEVFTEEETPDAPYIDVEETNLPVVMPSTTDFHYPATISGWAYNSLPFQTISFFNETLFAATNIQVSIVPIGETTVVAFEYFGNGLGVGPGGGVFNHTTSIMPNGSYSHIRLRPAHEVISGVHTNLLILEGDHGFYVEIPLTVTINQHPGGVANPASFVWPDLEEGYMLVDTFGAMTGPRHLNFTSNPPMLNVSDSRIIFASGADSPFELNRGLHNGATGGSPLTTIGPNTNIRIRPIDGLPVGLHEDILIIEGDGGSRIQVPLSINVTDWSGNFNFSQARDSIDFGVRDVGYGAFSWTADVSRWILTNTHSVTGISGIDGSQFVFASELTGGSSAFEFEPVGFRQGTSEATSANPPRGFIPPNNTNGQLRIRPRMGLPAGIYTDTLYIRGDRGFETTVELIFEVTMPDADISVHPANWIFPDEYEGYSFTPGGGAARGWREFVFRNNTPTNQPAVVFFESGENASTFEDGVTSPFRIHRGLTLNTLTNPSGSTAVIGHLNAVTETGIRIVPHNNLPVGTHTDVLVIRNNYGMDIRISLSFTVLPVPIDLHPDVIITPGRVHHFTTRQEGTIIPNTNVGWAEFRFFNHSGAPIPGVSARFKSGEDSPFAFNRAMGNGTGTGLTGGFVTISNAGTTVGANVRVWPRQDLPVGLHRDVLIIENNAGTFRQEIILYFEVTALNVNLDRNSFTWPTRHLGYNRQHQNSTVLTNVNNETDHHITGSAEFILTNHGDAPLRLPAWNDNAYTRGYFDSVVQAGGDTSAAWVVIHRGTNAQSILNPDATTGGTVTIVQPGMSVSLRFVPLANRPPGVYHDVFRLRDFYGNELGEIELNFTVIEWDLGPGVPQTIEFDARQVGYIINQHGNTSTSVHGTDAYVFNVTNRLADNNVESTPQILNPVFESELLNPGITSSFIANMGGSTGTGVNGRQFIPVDGNRHFWVRPRQGLAPGLHEDYLIFTSARTPVDTPLLRIPISIYIYEPDVVVREFGTVIEPVDGIVFANRMPGYTLDEHNVNDFIRLSFENLGTHPFTDVTATILQPDLSGPSTAFSVMTGIMPGDVETNQTTNSLPVDGMVNLRLWQRLDLPIGTHEAVLRLGNIHGFEVFVPLSFTVEDFDTEYFDVNFETRLEDFVEETQTAEFTLRNNSTTPAFIYSVTLEAGANSSFVLTGVNQTLGTIIGNDLLRFDVSTKPDLPAGLHEDYIIIRGNFGFLRRVRVSFRVLPVYHDLNFHLEGGSHLNGLGEVDFELVLPVRLNQPATRPAVNPTSVGYYFVDWFTLSEEGVLFDFSASFTRDFVASNGRLNADDVFEVDVFAQWGVSYHEVRFDVLGGEGTFLPQVIRDGGLVDEPITDPVAPVGYYFAGWFDSETEGDIFDFSAPLIRLNPSEVVVYARFMPLYHRVVFDVQSGSGTQFVPQTIRDGALVSCPTDEPTPPSGYVFRGWYTSPLGGSPFDFNTQVRTDVTLYARYMPITSVMLTFEPTGGVIKGYTGAATRVLEIGDSLGASLPTNPVRAGYQFTGWFTAPTGGETVTESWMVVGAQSFYAQWETLYHEVTFILDEGEVLPVVTVRDGEQVGRPSAPSRVGWDFVQWVDGAGMAVDFDAPITAATSIYAQWERTRLTVTFDLAGGTHPLLDTSPVVTVYYGETASMPEIAPVKPGYDFIGWVEVVSVGGLWQRLMTFVGGRTSGGLFDFGMPIVADVNLLATFEEIPQIGVTFDLMGGTHPYLVDGHVVNVLLGERLQRPETDPYLAGYNFLGWTVVTTADADETVYSDEIGIQFFDFDRLITEPLTLVAYFVPWANDITPPEMPMADVYKQVAFRLTGGVIDGDCIDTQLPFGALLERPTQVPMRAGYVFDDWYADETFETLFDFGMPVYANVEIFAGWQVLTEGGDEETSPPSENHPTLPIKPPTPTSPPSETRPHLPTEPTIPPTDNRPTIPEENATLPPVAEEVATGESGSGGGGTLPQTGTTVIQFAGFGLGLIGLSGGMIGVKRRRHTKK